jgi:hypothetical protein
MLVGVAILVVISTISREAWTLPAQPVTWVSVAYLVVFGSITMFGLYLFALRRWTASAVSYVTLLMPLVTVPLAAALIAEQVSLWFLVGGAIAPVGGVRRRVPEDPSNSLISDQCPRVPPHRRVCPVGGRYRGRDQDRFLTATIRPRAECHRVAPAGRRCVGHRHGSVPARLP